jgi:hypothetical protein
MLKNFLLVSLSFIILPKSILAQKSSAYFVELGGNGITETINYEKIQEKNSAGVDKSGVRIGIGFSPKYKKASNLQSEIEKEKGVAVCLVLGYNIFGNWGLSGINPNHFELGLNAVLISQNSVIEKIWKYKEKTRLFPSLNIGYRYQSEEKSGLLWKINYCPFYINSGLKHWIGISIGYSLLSK